MHQRKAGAFLLHQVGAIGPRRSLANATFAAFSFVAALRANKMSVFWLDWIVPTSITG
jgi:hypothetical protein